MRYNVVITLSLRSMLSVLLQVGLDCLVNLSAEQPLQPASSCSVVQSVTSCLLRHFAVDRLTA